MEIILNERKRAEQILEKGHIGKKPSSTLFLLAKYYQHGTGLSSSETETCLNQFMQANYENFTPALWEQTIENIIKKSASCKLREMDAIGITENELQAIRLLQNPKYERLVFVLLCHAKFHNAVSEKNNNWANLNIPELFRLARVTVRHKNDKYLYLNEIESLPVIENHSLISFSQRNDNLNIRIHFIDTEAPPVLWLDDFREPGYEYMNFLGEGKFVRCQECARLVKIKSKHDFSTKYCPICRKEKELEAMRKRIRKMRSKLTV